MLQATICDGVALDAFAFSDDRLRSSEVDVRRCNVADAFMVAVMIVVFDKVADLPFEVTG